MPADKLDQLRDLIGSYGSCLVAYSGGVDSVFLAHVAHQVLGNRALAVIADSPSLPRRELQEATAIAARFEFPLRVVRTREFENPDYLANPNNRCYFCKHELFSEIIPLARGENFAVIAYGENASDAAEVRPGAKAASEFRIAAPLKEVGLTKVEIRNYSAELGLPTAEKPQMACLSSRIPHGEAVTPEKLRMIEEAEYFLRDLGFYDVRVRHHEFSLESRVLSLESEGQSPKVSIAGGLRTQDSGLRPVSHFARIEIGSDEFPNLLANSAAGRVVAALKKIGYTHVTLDLQGYRGSSERQLAVVASAHAG